VCRELCIEGIIKVGSARRAFWYLLVWLKLLGVVFGDGPDLAVDLGARGFFIRGGRGVISSRSSLVAAWAERGSKVSSLPTSDSEEAEWMEAPSDEYPASPQESPRLS
jgi:hypothetical protein